MVRRLLSRRENKRRLADPCLVPIGGDHVLKAIAAMIAETDDGERFVFDGPFCPGGLTRAVVRRKNWEGGEAQVTARIEALHQAELIGLDASSVWLNLPPAPAAVADEHGFRSFKNSTGTKPGWMTEDQWRDYRRIHREGYAAQKAGDVASARAARARLDAIRPAQRNMLLSVAGGIARAQQSEDIAGHIEYECDIGPEIGGQMHAGGYTNGYASQADMPASHAAAAASASEIDISSVPAAAAFDDPHASATISAPISGVISPPISDQAISATDMLAAHMARRFGMSAAAVAEAPAVIQRWLDDGASVALILGQFEAAEETHRRKIAEGKPGIRGAGWFSAKMAEAIRARDIRALPVSSPQVAEADNATPDEEIADDPDCPAEWADAWLRVRQRLRERIGAVSYRVWFIRSGCSLAGVDDGVVTICAQTAMFRDYVLRQYEAVLAEQWRGELGRPVSIEVLVRPQPAPGVAGQEDG